MKLRPVLDAYVVQHKEMQANANLMAAAPDLLAAAYAALHMIVWNREEILKVESMLNRAVAKAEGKGEL